MHAGRANAEKTLLRPGFLQLLCQVLKRRLDRFRGDCSESRIGIGLIGEHNNRRNGTEQEQHRSDDVRGFLLHARQRHCKQRHDVEETEKDPFDRVHSRRGEGESLIPGCSHRIHPGDQLADGIGRGRFRHLVGIRDGHQRAAGPALAVRRPWSQRIPAIADGRKAPIPRWRRMPGSGRISGRWRPLPVTYHLSCASSAQTASIGQSRQRAPRWQSSSTRRL